jgi:hypothetical protein
MVTLSPKHASMVTLSPQQVSCGCEPWAEGGWALLQRAAGQGQVYAMQTLGELTKIGNDPKRAEAWFTEAAKAGLPSAMWNLAVSLDKGEGVAGPDYAAAVEWYTRAADAGDRDVAGGMLTTITRPALNSPSPPPPSHTCMSSHHEGRPCSDIGRFACSH